MKYTKNERKNDTIKVDFELNAKEWEAEVEEAYQKNKNKYKKEGFRQGKVPRKVLENTYGAYLFYEDALSDSFSKYYSQMLSKEKDIFPIDYPELSVDSLDEKGAKFSALIYVMPEYSVEKYKGFKVEKEKCDVKKAEITAELEQLRTRHARFVEITDRQVKNGDLINLNYSGSVNGVKFDGGTAEDQELEIGSKTFIEGFEEQVIGMSIGDEKDIQVKFPENYHSKELAGKDATFSVKVLGIREKELPNLDDEFAKEISEFSSLQALTLDIEERLSKEKETKTNRAAEDKLIKLIVDGVDLEVPEKMIEKQLDYFVRDLEMNLSSQGLNKEMYFQYMKTTEENFRKDRRKQAKETVKTSLVLEDIIQKEKIEVVDKDIDNKVDEIAKLYNQPVEKVKQMMNEQGGIASLRQEILSEKVIKFLKENNEII